MKFKITIKPVDDQAKELLPATRTYTVKGFALTLAQSNGYSSTMSGALNIAAVVENFKMLLRTLDGDQYEDAEEQGNE